MIPEAELHVGHQLDDAVAPVHQCGSSASTTSPISGFLALAPVEPGADGVPVRGLHVVDVI